MNLVTTQTEMYDVSMLYFLNYTLLFFFFIIEGHVADILGVSAGHLVV